MSVLVPVQDFLKGKLAEEQNYIFFVPHIGTICLEEGGAVEAGSDGVWTICNIEQKQACCAGCKADPSDATPTVNKIHPFSKTAVTFEPIQQFRWPLTECSE